MRLESYHIDPLPATPVKDDISHPLEDLMKWDKIFVFHQPLVQFPCGGWSLFTVVLLLSTVKLAVDLANVSFLSATKSLSLNQCVEVIMGVAVNCEG